MNENQKKVWVSPDGQGGWNVKSQDASRVAARFENKDDAIAKGKEIAKNAPLGQIII